MNLIVNKLHLNILLKRGYFSFLSALLSVIVLPIHVQYIPPFIILWVIFWILENYSQFDVLCGPITKSKLLLYLFITYYIWQLVGLLYSADINMGLLNLFGRLSLVLLPVILIFPGEMIKKKVNLLIRLFALSTALFMLFCFCYALYRSVNLHEGLWTINTHPTESPWLSYFYSSELTLSQHPTYIAMYVLLSAFICVESWFDFTLKFKHRAWWLILGSSLLISQYFLSSRAGILISLILVPFYFVRIFKKLGKRKFAWLWIILILIALLPVIVKNQRVDYLYGRIFHRQVDYERKEDPRFLIWKSTLKITKENILLGVGIGDARTELAHEYKRIGEEEMAKERFNAHNQFLEVLLENGIIGFVLFLSIFICMFYIAFSENNFLYALFILMIFLFFLFETILYRLAGVSFFSLFSFLLIHLKMNNQSFKVNIQIQEEFKDR